MNMHEIVDNLAVKMGSLYGDRVKFFREGIESKPLTEIVTALKMEFISPTQEGEYHIPIRYGSTEGTARYSLLNWAGENRPCLIFHHGSGEIYYTQRIHQILPKSVRSKINLIALSIPWNR